MKNENKKNTKSYKLSHLYQLGFSLIPVIKLSLLYLLGFFLIPVIVSFFNISGYPSGLIVAFLWILYLCLSPFIFLIMRFTGKKKK